MSKHRPPSQSQSQSQGRPKDVTSASSAVEIMRAKVAAQLEIIGRQAYADLLALRAELAKLPPLPDDPGPSDNDA